MICTRTLVRSLEVRRPCTGLYVVTVGHVCVRRTGSNVCTTHYNTRHSCATITPPSPYTPGPALVTLNGTIAGVANGGSKVTVWPLVSPAWLRPPSSKYSQHSHSIRFLIGLNEYYHTASPFCDHHGMFHFNVQSRKLFSIASRCLNR